MEGNPDHTARQTELLERILNTLETIASRLPDPASAVEVARARDEPGVSFDSEGYAYPDEPC